MVTESLQSWAFNRSLAVESHSKQDVSKYLVSWRVASSHHRVSLPLLRRAVVAEWRLIHMTCARWICLLITKYYWELGVCKEYLGHSLLLMGFEYQDSFGELREYAFPFSFPHLWHLTLLEICSEQSVSLPVDKSYQSKRNPHVVIEV
jgi:hypothetical protein